MRPVEQTRFWRPDDHPLGPSRGNCIAACVASIFEVPISQAEPTGTGDSQDLMRWTREQYPALRCEHRMLSSFDGEGDLESYHDWPAVGTVHNEGYWIASVYSYRIPSVMMTGCGCAQEPACLACEADRPDWDDYDSRLPTCPGCGSTDEPGYRDRPANPDCRWCHGRPDERELGVMWGLHGVVMKDRDLAWDPHPRRADGVGPIKSQMTWRCVDPALL